MVVAEVDGENVLGKRVSYFWEVLYKRNRREYHFNPRIEDFYVYLIVKAEGECLLVMNKYFFIREFQKRRIKYYDSKSSQVRRNRCQTKREIDIFRVFFF